jgi:hypothetical protein
VNVTDVEASEPASGFATTVKAAVRRVRVRVENFMVVGGGLSLVIYLLTGGVLCLSLEVVKRGRDEGLL